jgi:hypothetical protein
MIGSSLKRKFKCQVDQGVIPLLGTTRLRSYLGEKQALSLSLPLSLYIQDSVTHPNKKLGAGFSGSGCVRL